MIVEDSYVLRPYLIELLAEFGDIEIVGAVTDEDGALALYDERQPDAAVLDIRLRNGSGIAVLEHIKRRDRHCVVIMLTNCAEAEYRQRCQQAGADYFFEKFREFHLVAGVFRNILRQRQQGKEGE